MSKVVRRAMRPEDYEAPGEVTLFRLPAAPDEIVVVVLREEDYVTLAAEVVNLRAALIEIDTLCPTIARRTYHHSIHAASDRADLLRKVGQIARRSLFQEK